MTKKHDKEKSAKAELWMKRQKAAQQSDQEESDAEFSDEELSAHQVLEGSLRTTRSAIADESDSEEDASFGNDFDDLSSRVSSGRSINNRNSQSSSPSVTSIDSKGEMRSQGSVSSEALFDIMARQMGLDTAQQAKRSYVAPERKSVTKPKAVEDLFSGNKTKNQQRNNTPNVGALSSTRTSRLEDELFKPKRSDATAAPGKMAKNQHLEGFMAQRAKQGPKQAQPINAMPADWTDFKPLSERKAISAAEMQAKVVKAIPVYVKKVVPAAEAVLVASDAAIQKAVKITDDVLHNSNVPNKELKQLADDAAKAAEKVDSKTDRLEVIITQNFDILPQAAMRAATQLIELGDAVVKAAEEKAHAARAAIARNEAVESARGALAKIKTIQAAASKGQNREYQPGSFQALKDADTQRLAAARAEVQAAQAEARAREAELKEADRKAKEAAAVAIKADVAYQAQQAQAKQRQSWGF